jgi:mRNA interferase MazF
VVVRADALAAEHASVVICPMTFECNDAPDFRVTVDPTKQNGLRVRSQVIADAPQRKQGTGPGGRSAYP